MKYQDIKKYAQECVESNKEQYLEYLKTAIRFRTVNPPGNEDTLAEYLRNILSEHGIESRLQQVEQGRSNVIGNYSFGNGGKKLLLNSHMDVVAPGEVPWETDPFEPVVKDGYLYGRGSSDDKGGLIAMLIALLIFKEAGIEDVGGTIEFCGVMGEEASGIGTEFWLKQGGKADAAIVGEPSKLELVIAHRGAYRPQYSFYGRTAHSSEPSLGENAVYYAAHFVQEIEKLNNELEKTPHSLTGAPTIALTVINGGKKVNVIPDKATVQIDRRISPGEPLEDVKKQIQEILDKMTEEKTIGRYELDKCLNMKGAGEVKEDETIVQVVKEVLEEAGLPADAKGMRASTDMYMLTDAGIPTVIFAPGDMGVAHMPDESINIQQFLDSIPLYVDIFVRYFQNSRL